jgi:hypothetical protein
VQIACQLLLRVREKENMKGEIGREGREKREERREKRDAWKMTLEREREREERER